MAAERAIDTDAGTGEAGGLQYGPPSAPLRLSGAVAKPAPGTLPLRGDLAHIALAQRHLVQNYVVPVPCTLAHEDAVLRLQPSEEAHEVMVLAAGSLVELLDLVGNWAWVCLGPDGPSGFVKRGALAAQP